MAPMTGAARFRMPSRSTIIPPSSIPESVSATGKGDTVIGKGHNGALVTLVERKSLYTVIRAVLKKTAGAVRVAVKAALRWHKDRVHTLPYDNGREFTDHEGMARDLEAQIYFHTLMPLGNAA